MKNLPHLFENNVEWARKISEHNPDFFEQLSNQQKPEILWIGCSDSRVPANQIVGLDPGEVFVHRNIANVVIHSDFNCLSVIEYAVAVLKVKHIIVCGHYGCGGVQAATQNHELGLIDNWLRHIRDVREKHESALAKIECPDKRFDRMCGFNVQEQVQHVCHTTMVQGAWARKQPLSIHGWIYSLKDGKLKDLDTTITGPDQISASYRIEDTAKT